MTLKFHLTPILKFSSFFSLIPNYEGIKKTWKIRACAFWALMAAAIVWSNLELVPFVLQKRGTYIVIFLLVHLVNIFFYLTHYVRILFWEERFRHFLQQFDVVDEDFLKLDGVKVKSGGRSFWHIVLITFLIIFQIIGYFLSWRDLFKYMVYHDAQIYFDSIIAVLKYNFLKNIVIRYKRLNNLLEKVIPKYEGSQPSMAAYVDIVTGIHGNISDLIDFYNAFFGWHMLYNQIIIILHSLEIVELIVINEFDKWYDLVYVILSAICSYISLYEKTKAEGTNANTIALRSLHWYSDDGLISRKLAILVQQIAMRMPQFTAAGYFNVDYNMIFSFINITMTYVIVLIQSTK